MPALINRELSLTIGTTLIQSRIVEGAAQPLLRTTFNIERTLKQDPNKATIVIYNLNLSHRTAFQEADIPCLLEVGYFGVVPSRIFSGGLDFGSNVQDGTDWITTLEASDGGKKFRSARINKSKKGPISAGEVLRTAAEALGYDAGNIEEKITEGSVRKFTQYINGKVLSGKAEKVLDDVMKTLGYSWSVQDDKLQVVAGLETIGTTAQVISSTTGMVGSPQAGEKGFINVRSLIQPNLLPGNKIEVESSTVNGFYRIQKVVFSGDTHGQDWYADIEGQPL